MHTKLISQIALTNMPFLRIGDILNDIISDPNTINFSFSVAYMRLSGITRLSDSLNSLLKRGGSISGIVGVDDKITSSDALMFLNNISNHSTIFHTTSGYIYHPKLYIAKGISTSIVIVGSGNLTRDGLYRNSEIASMLYFDLNNPLDNSLFQEYELLMNDLLDIRHPNIQKLTDTLINTLVSEHLIYSEKDTTDPGAPTISPRSRTASSSTLSTIFPPLRVPTAPPLVTSPTVPRTTPTPSAVHLPIQSTPISRVKTPIAVNPCATFIMQLSSFDCSHKTGRPGTPEILIPKNALAFFPNILPGTSKYDEAYFDVTLHSPIGSYKYNYRLWYYDVRANGKPIDEHRLRMNHETIDLTTDGGGDLLVINKFTTGTLTSYEVTIVSMSDTSYSKLVSLCHHSAQGKIWGII